MEPWIKVEPSLFEIRLDSMEGLAPVKVEVEIGHLTAKIAASSGGKFAGVQFHREHKPSVSAYSADELASIYSPALGEALQKELKVGRYDWTGKTVVCPEHWDDVMAMSSDPSRLGETYLFTSDAKDICPICHPKEA